MMMRSSLGATSAASSCTANSTYSIFISTPFPLVLGLHYGHIPYHLAKGRGILWLLPSERQYTIMYDEMIALPMIAVFAPKDANAAYLQREPVAEVVAAAC